MSSKSEQTLAGKTVFITGAARGIGAELARRAAARGAKVALAGLEPELLAEVAGEIGGTSYQCDVTNQAELDDAVASTVAAYGGIDIAIANAGVANLGTVATGPVDALVRTIDINLNGVIRTTSAVLPHIAASRGYLLMISSVAAFTALPGMAAYCASKAGVEQFGNVLRMETRHLGVRIGTAHPSFVDTDMVRDVREDLGVFENSRSKLPWPLHRMIPLDECAGLLIRGIERRQRRIFVPRTAALVQALRTITLSPVAEAIIARSTGGGKLINDLENEARSLGRAFGRNSVG